MVGMRVHGTTTILGWGMGNLARVKSGSRITFKMTSNKDQEITIQGDGFDCRTNKTGGDGEWSNVAVQVIS